MKKIILLLLLLTACDSPQPVPTAEFRPTRPNAPTPTLVPPTTEPTPSMDCTNHDVTQWHEPGCGHHHGYNPNDYELGRFHMEHTGQELAHPWTSSPFENCEGSYPCKHVGFVNLYEANLGCQQTGREVGHNCITDLFVTLHTIGTIHAMHTDVHSFSFSGVVCDPALKQCGLVFTAGHIDFGVYHNGYKQEVCQLANDPPNYPYETGPGLNHLPYRASINNTKTPPFSFTLNPQFWNSRGPSEPWAKAHYPDYPNNAFQISFDSLDAWDMPDATDCANVESAVAFCPDGSCELNHTAYRIFAVVLQNMPTERPFVGFTDVNGHVVEDCEETSAECIPLIIEESVPLPASGSGNTLALLSRGTDHTFKTCGEFPCHDFENGTQMIMPGHEGHYNAP